MNDLIKPKVGDTIRIVRDHSWYGTEVLIFTLEEFRFCLGFFHTEEHRKCGKFTALSDCKLYGDGPETEEDYICNFGPYRTNQVPLYEIISS